MAPAQERRMECRAFGVISSQQQVVGELMAILRGACVTCNQFESQELIFSVPVKGGSTCLRLVKTQSKAAPVNPFADPVPEGWLMVHEGEPMRGAAAASLPAAVREVTESVCSSPGAPDFWKAVGATLEYMHVKKGNEYFCVQDGFELHAVIVDVATTLGTSVSLQPGRTVSGKSAGRYVMDVRTCVAEELYTQACQAIKAFGAMLTPLVTLQPALLPIGVAAPEQPAVKKAATGLAGAGRG